MDTTVDLQSEIRAIENVVATVEHAQRNELVEEFVSLFREDAIWTTGGGKLLIGRNAIAAFTEQVLPGAMKGIVPSYELVHVLFIRPDVAAVKVDQRYFSLEGSRRYVHYRAIRSHKAGGCHHSSATRIGCRLRSLRNRALFALVGR